MNAQDVEKISAMIREVANTKAMPKWGRSADAIEKAGGGGLQTPTDIEIERELTARLRALYPQALVVGEEGVSENPSQINKLDSKGMVFVIDPIDGTRAFAAGRPEFSTMVALQIDGKPVASWIYFPARKEMYITTPWNPMWPGAIFRQRGEELRELIIPYAPKKSAADMTMMNGVRALTDDNPATKRLKKHFKAMPVSSWAAGDDLSKLVRGEVDGIMYAQAKFNDIMPWLPFLKSMNYTVTTLDGNPYDPKQPKQGLIVAPDAATAVAARDLYAGRPTPAAPPQPATAYKK